LSELGSPAAAAAERGNGLLDQIRSVNCRIGRPRKDDPNLIALISQQHNASGSPGDPGGQLLQRLDAAILKSGHGETIFKWKSGRLMIQEFGFQFFDALA
jgi:hypothetical protein